MKSDSDCAGRAAAETGEEASPYIDRSQILGLIHEAYVSGRPVESVMRARMAEIRAGNRQQSGGLVLSSGIEHGRTIYMKRRCGKVASFFRCLLR